MELLALELLVHIKYDTENFGQKYKSSTFTPPILAKPDLSQE